MGDILNQGNISARDMSPLRAMFECKVLECQRKTKHPWEDCPYCHPSENARRRDVTKFRYAAEPCPDYANKEFCELGDDCPYAHGTFEVHLHPAKYCTKLCTRGAYCTRKICFFAHNESELREPDFSFGPKNNEEADLVKQSILASRRLQMLANSDNGPEATMLQQMRSMMPNLNNAQPLSINNTQVDRPHQDSQTVTLNMGLSNNFPPPALDLLEINDNWSLMSTPVDNAVSNNFCYTPQLDSSLYINKSSSQLSTQAQRTSPKIHSPSGGAPRMSVRKARELGIEPKKSNNHININAVTSGIPTKSAIPFEPICGISPANSPVKLSKQSLQWSVPGKWMQNVWLMSPTGVKMTMEQAIQMTEYMDGLKTGKLDSNFKRDWMAAASKLQRMGFVGVDEEIDVEYGSEHSSPDHYITRNRDPMYTHTATSTLHDELIPGPQCAALLAGSGLNLSSVSRPKCY